jgi:hypothetical protein
MVVAAGGVESMVVDAGSTFVAAGASESMVVAACGFECMAAAAGSTFVAAGVSESIVVAAGGSSGGVVVVETIAAVSLEK